MRVRFMIIVLTIATLFAYSLALPAERALSRTKPNRIALIIGNGDYEDLPLKNPVNDARAMATALKDLGFNVTLVEDADLRTMKTAVSNFGIALQSSEVGLFYYSGHGMQVNGSNYLLPVHALVRSKADLQYESLNAARVLSQMQVAQAKVNIVILDACRNNPYRSFFRSVSSQGLASMNAPHGSIIAYATGPGNVAEDGTGNNSPYTKYLLETLNKPIPIEKVFKIVREKVMAETQNSQVPWESSSLTGDFYFKSSPEEAPPTLSREPSSFVSVPSSNDKEIVFWETVSKVDSIGMYQAYLQQFPQGTFTELAQIRVKELEKTRPSLPTISTVENLLEGQVAWAQPEAIQVDSNKQVWILRKAKLQANADASYSVKVMRTQKGFIVDISKANYKWKKDHIEARDVISIAELLTR